MNFSIIIPTLNRVKDLEITLNSIIEQSYLPIEIIIIDQSDNEKTQILVEIYKSKINNINFHYKHVLEKSLTKARNLGLKLAKGEIVTFLDDDVLLEKNYLEEIANVFEEKNAVVVGGNITNWIRNGNKVVSYLNRLFLLSRIKKNSFEIQISYNPTEDYTFKTIINSQWASGCNHSILAIVAKEFRYDENFVMYCLGEDVDLTYRIYKKYQNGVFLTSNAKLQHFESVNARIPNKKKIYMDSVHKRYLFHKNIEQTFKHKLIFNWSRFGNLLKQLFNYLTSPNKNMAVNLLYTLEAEIYTFKNCRKIKNLDLAFFKDWLDI